MTPATGNLWQLHSQLIELMEAREELTSQLRTLELWAGSIPGHSDDAPSPEHLNAGQRTIKEARAELVALEKAMRDYVETKVAEVTDLRGAYFALIDGAKIAEAEAKRAANRALSLQNRADALKALIKDCMWALGKKRFESAMGSFLLAGNGGLAPLEVVDESLLPDEVFTVTVKMSVPDWDHVVQLFEEEQWFPDLSAKREVSNTAIRAALEKVCPECKGVPSPLGAQAMATRPDVVTVTCTACAGSGRAGVPGARLLDRGTNLRIK